MTRNIQRFTNRTNKPKEAKFSQTYFAVTTLRGVKDTGEGKIFRSDYSAKTTYAPNCSCAFESSLQLFAFNFLLFWRSKQWRKVPLFNLSALTRHTAYSAAFLLHVPIRKITRLLRIQSSVLIGKHFPHFAGHLSSAARSTVPLWQTRRGYSQQVPGQAPSRSLTPLPKPGAGGRTLEGPCSWPFLAQFHKVNETCRGIAAGNGATRALQSITSGVQRHLPPPCTFASHSLMWSRISDSLFCAKSSNEDCGWNEGE